MEVVSTVSIAGIIISLTISFLLLCSSLKAQRRSQANLAEETSCSRRATIAPDRNSPQLEAACHTWMIRSDIKLIAISHDRGCQERLKEVAKSCGWELYLCATWADAESVL